MEINGFQIKALYPTVLDPKTLSPKRKVVVELIIGHNSQDDVHPPTEEDERKRFHDSAELMIETIRKATHENKGEVW